MKGITVRIYRQGEALPQLSEENFFHSPELFHIMEQVPGAWPFMIVATNGQGQEAGHLLVTLSRQWSWFPPFVYTHARAYGEGVYPDDDANHEEVFGAMLHAITQKLRHTFCLYSEFSDLSVKMFGYKWFRQNGFFPVRWQEVHNSLHSMAPADRLTTDMRDRIRKMYAHGVETREVESDEEVHAFYKMLHGFYRMKLRRYIPPRRQFEELANTDNARILITRYKGKIIGGCACVYSEGNAFLWYLASKRKSHTSLHPETMTVWYAIAYAYEHNFAHIFFLDVGLPWKKNPFRDFILSFGGKPIGRYRWFRFSIGWLNRLLSWIYKE